MFLSEKMNKKMKICQADGPTSRTRSRTKAVRMPGLKESKQDSSTSVPSTMQPKINDLPSEILAKIFTFVSHNDLGRLARVCRHWNDVKKCPLLWKKVVVELPLSIINTTSFKYFLENLSSCTTHLELNFHTKQSEEDRLKNRMQYSLNFLDFLNSLREKCPNIEELILAGALFTISGKSPILSNAKQVVIFEK